MEDASKPEKETPEETSEEVKDEPSEEPQPEVESDEEPTEPTEDQETETQPEKEPTEPVEEKESGTEETSEEIEEEKPEEEPSETREPAKEPEEPKQEKPEKTEAEKEPPKKRADRGPDFKYIVRLASTDVNGEKNLVYGLTSIKGVGVHMATLIADETGIDRYKKIGDLKDDQIEKIQETIDNVIKNAPGWMLNHRKDYDTGDDTHLIGSDIDMRLRDEINIMKKIRSYRGIRHERGLPVRGQRTRANNRKGLALGVSKKRVRESANK